MKISTKAIMLIICLLTACSSPIGDVTFETQGTDEALAASPRPATLSAVRQSSTVVAAVTETPIPVLTPTPALTLPPTRTPIPIVEIESYAKLFPKPWPLTPLTEEQIMAVQTCNIEDLAEQRYPQRIKIEELPGAYDLVSACDWAVLATIYAKRTQSRESLPEAATRAYAQAVVRNPGFALVEPLFSTYFSALPLVETPPFVQRAIVEVQIDYWWGGMGVPVSYTARIADANTIPYITVAYWYFGEEPLPDTVLSAEQRLTVIQVNDDYGGWEMLEDPVDYNVQILSDLNLTVEASVVQSLSLALTDLVPVESQFTLQPCDDNMPDWTVYIGFEDGTNLELVTNSSNFMYAGGPWYTKIDGQNYIQLSPAFLRAIGELVDALRLPRGQPAAMACFGRQNPLEMAYPKE